jgi:hypothetical protein
MSLQGERLNHGSTIMTEGTEHYDYRRFLRNGKSIFFNAHPSAYMR